MEEKRCKVYTRELRYASEIDTESFQEPEWSQEAENTRRTDLFVGLLNQLEDEITNCLKDPTNKYKMCNLRKVTNINCKERW